MADSIECLIFPLRMTNSSKFSGKDVTKKDKSMEHVLREELELVSVAASELTKLKRQLRQTKSELKSWQLNNKKTVERQEKAIRLLEKEKKDCQIKWTAIKEAQKPPTTAINVLVDKYHKTVQQLDDIKCQLQTAKEELNQAENKRHNRGQPVGVDRSQCSFKVQDAQHKLDQVIYSNLIFYVFNPKFMQLHWRKGDDSVQQDPGQQLAVASPAAGDAEDQRRIRQASETAGKGT